MKKIIYISMLFVFALAINGLCADEKGTAIKTADLSSGIAGGKYRPKRIIVDDFETEPSCYLQTKTEAWGSCYPHTKRIGPFDPQFDPAYVHTGSASYRIVNCVRSKRSWGCFCMNLGPVRDITKDPIGIEPIDVSQYEFFSFWVKGTKGGEQFKVIFRDAQAETYMPVTIYTPDDDLADVKWKRVLLNLSEVKQKMEGYVKRPINWSELVAVGIEIGDNVGNPRGTTIYIDDLEFIK